MDFKIVKELKNPYGAGTVREVYGRLWVVQPERGDLYVARYKNKDELVRLLDGGIVDRPNEVTGSEWLMRIDDYRHVVALHVDDANNAWSRCERLP